MKNIRKFLLALSVLLLSSLLTACGGAIVSAWPGVTYDPSSDTIYVAANTHIYGVNPSNGAETWRYPQEPDNKIAYYAPPVITPDGHLLAGTYSNLLVNVDPKINSLVWSFTESKNKFIASPLFDGDMIFAPSADHGLYALDLSGNLQWKFTTDHAIWSTPATNGKLVYLASMDHHVYALNRSTGELVWKSEDLGGTLVSAPVLNSQGLLYIGTFGKELVALNLEDGHVAWRAKTAGWVWSAPLLVNERLYFGDLEGTLYAVDAISGAVIWQTALDSSEKRAITGKPAMLGDTLVVASESGNLFLVDPANGSVRSTKTLQASFNGDIVVAGDLALVASINSDELLFAFDKDGNQKWAFIPIKK